MKIKQAHFEIDLQKYHEAIDFSLHDHEWLQKTFSNKENILDFTNDLITKNNNVAVNKFLFNRNIAEFLNNKSNTTFSEEKIDLLLGNTNEKTNRSIINQIKSKTFHNAKIAESLLKEYCDRTRDVFTGIITPIPQNIEETTLPIKKFQVKISKEVSFNIGLNNTGLEVLNDHENLDVIQKYFENRQRNKNIIRCYLDDNIINEKIAEEITKKFLYVKESTIPSNFAFADEKRYKVIVRESNVCLIDNCYFSINTKPLKVSLFKDTKNE